MLARVLDKTNRLSLAHYSNHGGVATPCSRLVRNVIDAAAFHLADEVVVAYVDYEQAGDRDVTPGMLLHAAAAAVDGNWTMPPSLESTSAVSRICAMGRIAVLGCDNVKHVSSDARIWSQLQFVAALRRTVVLVSNGPILENLGALPRCEQCPLANPLSVKM